MSDDDVIEDPTYMEHVRHFFTSEDKQCMGAFIDLSTYAGVRDNHVRIYATTRNGSMPKGRPAWSTERVQTFRNWIDRGFRRGTVEPALEQPETPNGGLRVRKNIVDLSDDEFQTLIRAFRGLLDRDDNDPSSYYQLAGVHWLPKPNMYCRHHEDAYNPWHRIYLLKFENALRSVDGCEDVTLPYWDIQSIHFPEQLEQLPFESFTYPETLRDLINQVRAEKGDSTVRNDPATILTLVDQYGIDDDIKTALGHSWWEGFNGWDATARSSSAIIRAHDSGHVACGETLADQNVAAFDPLFWFFHCNWDRLWWLWQQLYGATSLEAFKTHLPDSGDWLTDPLLADLKPFFHEGTPDYWKTSEAIDSHALGIGYEHPVVERIPFFSSMMGHMEAHSSMSVPTTSDVSVRVKGIDRLKIPGSFDVSLLVDGNTIAKRGFFQPTTPRECAGCSKKGIVSLDFVVPDSAIRGELSVAIKLIRDGKSRLVPLASCGNPTINVRLLLKDERP